MTMTSYLFEKACYSLDALAGLAEGVRLEPDSRAQRDVSYHCQVATPYALTTLSMVARMEFDAGWVIRVMRDGRWAWQNVIKPALETAHFGPSSGSNAEAAGLPREFAQSDDEPKAAAFNPEPGHGG